MRSRLSHFKDALLLRIKRIYSRVTGFIIEKPGVSFFGLIGLLFAFILVGNFLRRPPLAPKSADISPKEVNVVSIGGSPYIKVQGRVEKSGVVQIVAQSSGIVQKIHTAVGKPVNKGTQLVWLSSNYQGGTLPSVSRAIAEKNLTFTTENFDTQKDLLGKRRELAEKLDTQTGELRDITSDSLSDTRSLISLNEEIIRTLDSQLSTLDANNVGGVNDTAILQLKQGKAQAQAGLNALRSGLKNTEYLGSDDKTPAGLSHLTKDITLKQLELEEKSLNLNKELATLNLKVARVSEAFMYPASPVAGIVERIHVSVGQNVNPGTPLMIIKGDQNDASVVVLLSSEMAKKLSPGEKSRVQIKDKTYEVTAHYVSLEPTDGAFNTVLFSLPPEAAAETGEGTSLVVELPLLGNTASQVIPFIPLDAIFQTQSKSYVFVAEREGEGWIGKSREVTLGAAYGNLIEVKNGLTSGDQVIVTRTVLDGDRITFH